MTQFIAYIFWLVGLTPLLLAPLVGASHFVIIECLIACVIGALLLILDKMGKTQ